LPLFIISRPTPAPLPRRGIKSLNPAGPSEASYNAEFCN
jgi:hypothetical protein